MAQFQHFFNCPLCDSIIYPEIKIPDPWRRYDRHYLTAFDRGIPEFYPATCPNGAELELIPLAGSTPECPVYQTNVTGFIKDSKLSKDELFDLFRRNTRLETTKTVRLELIKYRVPKRFKFNRRIHKKTLKRRGLPYYYYDKEFRFEADLRPCEKQYPVTINTVTRTDPPSLPLYLSDPWLEVNKPYWEETPRAYKPEVKLISFPRVGYSRRFCNFYELMEFLKRVDWKVYFWNGAYNAIIADTTIKALE